MRRLTDEQQRLIDEVLDNGRNVAVRAVPGAGKSTALIELAKQAQARGRSPLVVVYSKVMKEEWRELIGYHNATNFDAMAKKVFAFDESGNANEVERHLAAETPMTNLGFDLLLIDEAQDITSLYTRFLKRYAETFGKVQTAVVGDERQTLYTFNADEERNATPSALTDARHFLADVAMAELGWVDLRFSVSFRLTPAITPFVHALFGLDESSRIVGRGVPRDDDHAQCGVHYHVINLFHEMKTAKLVAKYVDAYGAANVIIINPTRFQTEKKGKKRPIDKLTNALNVVRSDIQIASSEDGGIGNVVIHTTCSCKGLESKCIIVLNADAYSDWVTDEQWYVALTRASQRVVILHHCENACLNSNASVQWLRQTPGVKLTIHDCLNIKKKKQPPAASVSVTELAENPGPRMRDLVEGAEWVETSPPSASVAPLPSPEFQHAHGSFQPCVGDILGVAVTMLVERDRGPPKNYKSIFDPILLHTTIESFLYRVFADPRLPEPVRQRARERQAELQRLASLVRAKDERACTRIAEMGFHKNKLNDRESMSAFAKALVGKAECVVFEDEYAAKFPMKKREQLRTDVPLDVPWTPKQAVQAACAAQSMNGPHYRLWQIPDYDWVDESFVADAAGRVRDAMGAWSNAEAEMRMALAKAVSGSRMAPYNALVGIVDFEREDGSIIEVKTSSGNLTDSHKAQLWLYAHMRRAMGGTDGLSHQLMNAASGQVLRLRIHTSVEESRELLAQVLREHGRIEDDIEWLWF